MPSFTLFFDSRCPLCVEEMHALAGFDQSRQLEFVDIHQPHFAQQYPHIDPVQANRKLHGQYASGELVVGLDATAAAWQLVGKHQWLQALRWPVIRWLADGAYWVFARNRYRISSLLGRRVTCSGNTCR